MTDTTPPIDAITKLQQEVVALRMLVQAMLVFMTDAREGETYDRPMIRRMRESLLDTIDKGPPEEIPQGIYDFWVEGIQRTIHDVLDPLAGDA